MQRASQNVEENETAYSFGVRLVAGACIRRMSSRRFAFAGTEVHVRSTFMRILSLGSLIRLVIPMLHAICQYHPKSICHASRKHTTCTTGTSGKMRLLSTEFPGTQLIACSCHKNACCVESKGKMPGCFVCIVRRKFRSIRESEEEHIHESLRLALSKAGSTRPVMHDRVAHTMVAGI